MTTTTDLWNELATKGWQAIDELCTRGEPEGQILEFKTKTDPRTSELSREDRKNLGKALSAFSNAVGGILIWGVRTGKSADETVAQSPQLIADIVGFERRVSGLVPEYLSPPNTDIETLPLARSDGEGFLAIRIGRSDSRPHMSLAPDDRRYYGRAGDQSQPLVDYQVRDLMRIKTVPRLAIRYQVERAAQSATTRGRLLILIRNASELSARYAYVVIRENRDLMVESKFPNFETVGHTDRNTRVIQANGNLIINPGIEARIVQFYLEVEKKANSRIRIRFNPDHQFERCVDRRNLRVEAAVGCQDSPARWFVAEFTGTQLEDMADALVVGRETSGNFDPMSST